MQQKTFLQIVFTKCGMNCLLLSLLLWIKLHLNDCCALLISVHIWVSPCFHFTRVQLFKLWYVKAIYAYCLLFNYFCVAVRCLHMAMLVTHQVLLHCFQITWNLQTVSVQSWSEASPEIFQWTVSIHFDLAMRLQTRWLRLGSSGSRRSLGTSEVCWVNRRTISTILV